MKRKILSLKLPSKKRVKGIIVSTEMILLLTAVIVFSVITFFGISKTVLSQATSSKQTLVVVRAEAWKIGDGIAVTMYVHNTGSSDVKIDKGGIKFTYSGSLYYCETYIYSGGGWWGTTYGITVRPGETKVISFAVGKNNGDGNGCDYVHTINSGASIYVYIEPVYGSGIWDTIHQEVGTAVKVTTP